MSHGILSLHRFSVFHVNRLSTIERGSELYLIGRPSARWEGLLSWFIQTLIVWSKDILLPFSLLDPSDEKDREIYMTTTWWRAKMTYVLAISRIQRCSIAPFLMPTYEQLPFITITDNYLFHQVICMITCIYGFFKGDGCKKRILGILTV